MQIQWGIIGTGDVAERKGGPALYQAENSNLVAVTNRSLPRAKDFATRHGNPTVHANVDELLSNPDVNAVYVATPPSSHAELTARVAAAGKHVFCEKPMAMTVAECQGMIEVCQQHQVSLAIAYYRRYFPIVVKMKQLLEAGAIGRPLRIAVTTISQFHSNEEQPWRLDAAIAGGGFLMDMGTHRFDLMAHFFGPAKRVLGMAATQTLAANVEDAATVMLEFANDVQGSAAFQWNCPVSRDTLEIVGTDGILSTDSLSNAGRLSLETKAGIERWQLPASAPVHLPLVQQFVNHLLCDAPNPLAGESGQWATAMASEVYRST